LYNKRELQIKPFFRTWIFLEKSIFATWPFGCVVFFYERSDMMKQSRYGLCVFLGGCCYGILSTFVKFAYKAGFTPNEVSGGQYLFGVLIIWLIFLFTKKQKLSLKQVLILLVSGIPFGLTSICYYRALQSLNASLAIIFLFQFVWIGSLFDFIFNHHKPTKQKLISIVILLAGSLLASGVFAQSASFSLTGMLWGILSAFTYTAGMFLSGQVEKIYHQWKEVPSYQRVA
jgi:drug/metabolite transporter (DMT)-like permease